MVAEISKLRERRKLWKTQLLRNLASLKRQLIKLGALKIILFGSVAEDNVRYGSDLDLIIIMPDTKTSKEWRKELYSILEWDTGCDFFIYNQNSFNQNKDSSALIKTALKTGKIIYER